MQCVEAKFHITKVHHQHVPGHAGDALNELADTLAWNTANGRLRTLPPPYDFRALLHGDALRNLWLCLELRLGPPHWPALLDDQLHLPPRHGLQPLPATTDWTFGYGATRPQTEAGQTQSWNLRICTHNVQSLQGFSHLPDTDGGFIGKLAYYRSQLHREGIHLAGLQETRFSQQRVWPMDGYTFICTAADQGHGGVALAIQHKAPIYHSGRRPIFFDATTTTVLHSDPRLLLLRLETTDRGRYIIVVGHAPHQGHTAATKSTWWSSLRQKLRLHQGKDPCLAFLDANADVGYNADELHVGSHGGTPDDTNGEELFLFLQETASWLPSTFQRCHHGKHETWYGNASRSGSGKRLDYIVLPQTWTYLDIKTYVDEALDPGHANVDHFALTAHVQGLQLSDRPRFARTARTQIDWPAVRQCRDDNTWRKIFGAISSPAWTLDPHAHCEAARALLLEQLAIEFPITHGGPRRRYVSAQAWTLRKTRLHLKRQFLWRFPIPLANDTMLALRAWHDDETIYQCALRAILEQFRLLRDRLQVRGRLQVLSGQLRAQLKADRLHFLESVAVDADTCEARHLYATLRRAGFGNRKRQQPRQLPYLLDENDEPYNTKEALQQAWQRHFAQIETGYGVSSLELLQLCQLSDLAKPLPTSQDIADMPCLKLFEDALRRARPHRASGPDAIVPELCKNAAKYMAHYLYPLFVKSSLYRSEPIQFKGGILCEVYKGKGPTTATSSYRGILVSSQVAKAFHNMFRQQALPSFTDAAEGLHCGGYPGRPVEFASHGIRLFHAACNRMGRSTGILFVDIRSAYYRLLRQLSIGETCSEAELCRVLAVLRLPDHALLDLYKALHEQDSSATRHAMAPFAQAQAQAYHQNTWFHTRNSPELTRTLCGTRPGDGWADLMFNMVMLDVLAHIKDQTHAAGLLLQIDWNGCKNLRAGPGDLTSDYVASTWADDIALVVQHASADSIIPALRCLTQITIDVLSARGLLLNYGPGKTELLVNIRGKNSVAHRRQLLHEDNGQLQVETETQGLQQIRVVQRYRHLGSLLHASGKMGYELRIRLGMARQAFQKHRKAIYQQPKLALTKRFQIFRSCVLSVAFFGAGTWTPIHPKEWVSFSHGIIQLLKRLVAADVHHETLLRWSDSRICSFVGCPLPLDLLRISRLTYYRSLLQHGPDILWALVQLEDDWHRCVRDDIAWLWKLVGPFPKRPSPEEDLDYWPHLAATQPGVWKNLLRKAYAKLVLRLSIDTEVQVWHMVFKDFLQDAGMQLPATPDQPSESHDAAFACLCCRKLFKTKAAWAVHSFKQHGRRAPHRYHADGPTCDACGRLFLNHVRLGDHLRNNPHCLQELRNRGIFLAPLPGRNSRAWRKADPWTQCPYLVSEGPRMTTHHAIDDLMPVDLDFIEHLVALEDQMDFEHSPTAQPDWVIAIKDLCLQTPLAIDRLQRHLSCWATDLSNRWFLRRLRPSAAAALHRAIQEVVHLASVPYFLPAEHAEWLRGCPVTDTLSAEASIAEAATLPDLAYQPNPRNFPRFRQLVFAHLYSGHRRDGDLQAQLDRLDWSPDLPPLILSIDVVIDNTRCNVFDPAIRSKWYSFALSGGLHGLMAGPPCESWSVARERYLTTGEGPRPLRRRTSPWAVDDFTIKEGRQLFTANLLLFFSVLLMLCQWKARTWGCLEHPATPSKEDAPSIWMTGIFRLLCRLEGIQLDTLFQGYYGAVSPKPTSFMSIWDCGHLRSLEHQHRIKRHLPPPLAMGRKAGASFYATAQLKAYPPALCGLLADAFFHHVRCVHHTHDDDPDDYVDHPPEVLQEFTSLIAPIVPGAMIGPDFAF
eukprot:Skav226336  [mRNA]  locus=scaffold3640:16495:21969:- [translate_table: standard]